MAAEMIDQRRPPGLARFRVAQRVEVQRHGLVHAKLVQKLRREGEKLDIGGRFARADDLRVKLMELAEAPFLLPLVTAERPPRGKHHRRPFLPARDTKRDSMKYSYKRQYR